MIEAEHFVASASQRGFDFYSGVPCSFLTPFINYIIDSKKLRYITAPNEGDAVAVAAGAFIGGRRAVAMMQNSGIGNAVNPLTSLTHTFQIPVLLICTHRGAPGVRDEPQHNLMGDITNQLLDTIKVTHSPFPKDKSDIKNALDLVDYNLFRNNLPHALIMQKGTCAPYPAKRNNSGSKQLPIFTHDIKGARHTKPILERPSRKEVLKIVLDCTKTDDWIIVASTGYAGRELYALEDRSNHFYMVGSMGCASSLALGLALSCPQFKILVIDGDGAALMRLGNLSMIGSYRPSNLFHLLLDNEVHDSTGSQKTTSQSTDLAKIAEGCGYQEVWRTDETDEVRIALEQKKEMQLTFAHVKTRPGTANNLPRPSLSPPEVKNRLIDHIKISAEK